VSDKTGDVLGPDFETEDAALDSLYGIGTGDRARIGREMAQADIARRAIQDHEERPGGPLHGVAVARERYVAAVEALENTDAIGRLHALWTARVAASDVCLALLKVRKTVDALLWDDVYMDAVIVHKALDADVDLSKVTPFKATLRAIAAQNRAERDFLADCRAWCRTIRWPTPGRAAYLRGERRARSTWGPRNPIGQRRFNYERVAGRVAALKAAKTGRAKAGARQRELLRQVRAHVAGRASADDVAVALWMLRASRQEDPNDRGYHVMSRRPILLDWELAVVDYLDGGLSLYALRRKLPKGRKPDLERPMRERVNLSIKP
jgi:hypothetical protein